MYQEFQKVCVRLIIRLRNRDVTFVDSGTRHAGVHIIAVKFSHGHHDQVSQSVTHSSFQISRGLSHVVLIYIVAFVFSY